MAVEDQDLGTTQEVYYNAVIFNIQTHQFLISFVLVYTPPNRQVSYGIVWF